MANRHTARLRLRDRDVPNTTVARGPSAHSTTPLPPPRIPTRVAEFGIPSAIAHGYVTGVLRRAGVRRRPQRSASCPGVAGAARRIRARPSVNAHPDVVRARESAADRRAWRNYRHRPATPPPRAPDEPSAALGWSLDGTPAPVRRRSHRPAQPGRSVSRGYPGRA